MQITKNFTLNELIFSQTAIRHKINNYPDDEEIIDNLVKLTTAILQPCRDYFNKPLIITSGYRNRILNNLIGGAKTSQHMTGHAADFTILKVPNQTVINYIKQNLDYDQLIDEFGSWVHVSFHQGHNRKMFLKFR